MAEQKAYQELKQPIKNSPKDVVKGKKAVAKPIVIAEGSIESQIISDLVEGNNVYLMGKAGTGKTYLAKALSDAIGQESFLVNCSQFTSPVEIRGGQTIKGYEEGQLIKAWATGGIFILDELPKLDPNTAGLLNDALAEAAAQPKYDENGKVIENTIPYIVNGKGERIYKGQDQKNDDLKFRFCVIATGNTDMMNVGNKYAGNQRQDYSLVDRFAGSFYTLDENSTATTEMKLVYKYVYGVSVIMRKFLNEKDAVQSISLRTMLNFNRTYEQQMLYKIGSPYADDIYDSGGNLVPPKNVQKSFDSFLGMLEPNLRRELEDMVAFKEAIDINNPNATDEAFKKFFRLKYGLDPITGKEVNGEGNVKK
jgi:cobaltochelatase CobS